MNIIKDTLFWIGIGTAILFTILFLTNLIFGDLTTEDSFAPLWVILPVFIGAMISLIYFSNKASKK